MARRIARIPVGLTARPPKSLWLTWCLLTHGAATSLGTCSKLQTEEAPKVACLGRKPGCSTHAPMQHNSKKMTRLCPLGVKLFLPHGCWAILKGTGWFMLWSSYSSFAMSRKQKPHLAMDQVSHGGAAPKTATLPWLKLAIQKDAAPLEMSWWDPRTMSTTAT